MHEKICRQVFGQDYSSFPDKSYIRIATNYIVRGIRNNTIHDAADVIVALSEVEKRISKHNKHCLVGNRITNEEDPVMVSKSKIRRIVKKNLENALCQEVTVTTKTKKEGIKVMAMFSKPIKKKTQKYLKKDLSTKFQSATGLTITDSAMTCYITSKSIQQANQNKKEQDMSKKKKVAKGKKVEKKSVSKKVAKSSNSDRIKAKANGASDKVFSKWEKKYTQQKYGTRIGAHRFIMCTVADNKKGKKFGELAGEVHKTFYSHLPAADGKRLAMGKLKTVIRVCPKVIAFKNKEAVMKEQDFSSKELLIIK